MTFQMRREHREEVTRQAWLDLGDKRSLVQGTVVDISQSGAKLAFDGVESIPATFGLLLSRKQRFSCQIVWPSSNTVGVSFISG